MEHSSASSLLHLESLHVEGWPAPLHTMLFNSGIVLAILIFFYPGLISPKCCPTSVTLRGFSFLGTEPG